ncbi:unnamed protein product [Vitrella brassicaformis CCMP3155]|uniref:Ion transport domain-containing protein n=1 Tax=Vitrella brassicaformis (strain CCMP3155) TaxID=1169540 RepID=A0A0G4EF67_VITBC|nr:unnamed protein product [Vitrella brassicaformis CCMP3155]|eukprot:CEL94174.1 unnamed protein product [Vitrella brassicaformis CCMP3155]
MCSGVSIIGFIAIHFTGWSMDAEVGSGIVVALLFALRLLQTASLHPAVGPLILAVVRMFSDISMFLCLYVYILLVFAVVFTLLSSDEDHQYFGSFAKATLTLFFAGLGEFNDALTNAIESHDTLGAALLFTYVILSSIILASTYAAIEHTQTAQYHCGRVGAPAASRQLISEQRQQQSALCCIAFWSMRAIYVTVDALLHAVAFTPIEIYHGLDQFQQEIREGKYWEAFQTALLILVMPFYLLYLTSEERRRSEQYRDKSHWVKYERSIDKWIEAADHHDSNFPDVMAAVKYNQSSQSETLSVLREMQNQLLEMQSQQKQMDGRQLSMGERLTEIGLGAVPLVLSVVLSAWPSSAATFLRNAEGRRNPKLRQLGGSLKDLFQRLHRLGNEVHDRRADIKEKCDRSRATGFERQRRLAEDIRQIQADLEAARTELESHEAEALKLQSQKNETRKRIHQMENDILSVRRSYGQRQDTLQEQIQAVEAAIRAADQLAAQRALDNAEEKENTDGMTTSLLPSDPPSPLSQLGSAAISLQHQLVAQLERKNQALAALQDQLQNIDDSINSEVNTRFMHLSDSPYICQGPLLAEKKQAGGMLRRKLRLTKRQLDSDRRRSKSIEKQCAFKLDYLPKLLRKHTSGTAALQDVLFMLSNINHESLVVPTLGTLSLLQVSAEEHRYKQDDTLDVKDDACSQDEISNSRQKAALIQSLEGLNATVEAATAEIQELSSDLEETLALVGQGERELQEQVIVYRNESAYRDALEQTYTFAVQQLKQGARLVRGKLYAIRSKEARKLPREMTRAAHAFTASVNVIRRAQRQAGTVHAASLSALREEIKAEKAYKRDLKDQLTIQRGKLKEGKQQMGGVMAELNALTVALAQMEQLCGPQAQTMTYEERARRRQEEIDALKDVLELITSSQHE